MEPGPKSKRRRRISPAALIFPAVLLIVFGVAEWIYDSDALYGNMRNAIATQFNKDVADHAIAWSVWRTVWAYDAHGIPFRFYVGYHDPLGPYTQRGWAAPKVCTRAEIDAGSPLTSLMMLGRDYDPWLLCLPIPRAR
jgi:hypothetical protein